MIGPLLLLALTAGAAAPEVRSATKVVTRSWTPLELPAVERMVEVKVLAVLGDGGLRLVPSGFAELGNGAYKLLIEGRFIEEAEKFSVYLSFGPGQESALPSLFVSDTDGLGGLAKPVMQARIEALAERAARRLAGVLRPELTALAARLPPPPPEDPVLPFAWGPIEVPAPTTKSQLLRQLLEVQNEDHVRHKALAEIKGQAFEQPAARDALVVCMLRDPTPALRADCAEALEPVARTHVPTQRLILHALRNEVEASVLRTLVQLSKTFVGLSRKETVETWLELVSSEHTPGDAADDVASLLADEGEVPNLEIALSRCFALEALAYGKRYACANQLLRRVPEARRPAVVWRYLERASVWEGGESNVFERVEEAVAAGSKPVAGPLAELFLALAERRSGGRVRDDALLVAGRHAEPSAALLERVLVLGRDPTLTWAAARAVLDLVGRRPELAPAALAGLRQLRAEMSAPRPKHRGSPQEELDSSIRRLEQRKG